MSMMSRLGQLLRYSHYLGRYFVDRTAVLFTSSKRSDVLLIIRPDGIGDFVVWLDSARVLREHYSEKKIVLVANQIFAELAEKLEHFDEIIAVDFKKFERDLGYRFRVVRQISSLGAEIAIQPIHSRRFWTGDSMILASGAQQRIGSEGHSHYILPWQQRIAKRWYTRLVPASTGPLTELDRNIEFLQGMGISNYVPGIATIPVVTELPLSLQIKDDYFIVFPGAGSSKRIWAPHSYASVARTVSEKTGWRMIVCGSTAEAELAETIIEYARLDEAVALAGQTSVPELVEVIRGARMIIGSETSAMHIAAAVSTPSVCLLGGGHFGRFVPYPVNVEGVVPSPVFHKMECYGCNWQCTQSHEAGQPVPCISAISVEKVVAAAEVIISARQVNVTEPR